MKKIFVSIFMGLFIFGGTASLNICNAASFPQDIVSWHYLSDGDMKQRIASTITVSKDVVSYFIEKGYAPMDIAMAGLLAGQNYNVNVHISNISEILSKKASSNTWQDIATAIGVDQETYNQYMERAKKLV
ncbi:MAG: hypothetical protein H6Q67_2260 [Firmicutes bacterium]|nr:hypothetical protein [Bacillota bacterium]